MFAAMGTRFCDVESRNPRGGHNWKESAQMSDRVSGSNLEESVERVRGAAMTIEWLGDHLR